MSRKFSVSEFALELKLKLLDEDRKKERLSKFFKSTLDDDKEM